MAKKKKQDNKRRLLLLILLLVFTVALIGGATYAWFTQNTRVSIETLDLSVSVTKGIEISADALNWGAQVKLADLYAAAGLGGTGTSDSKAVNVGAYNQFPEKLDHISSVGNVIDNKLQLFTANAANVCANAAGEYKAILSIDQDGNIIDGISNDDCKSDISVGLTEVTEYKDSNTACTFDDPGSKSACSPIKVIAFDVYLKLDQDAQVSLAQGSVIKNKAGKDMGLKNTVRVAFVTLGTQPDSFYFAANDNIKSDGTVKDYNTTDGGIEKAYADIFGGYAGQYGAVAMNTFGQIVIWEPNVSTHDAYGNAEAAYNRDYVNGTIKAMESMNDTFGIYQLTSGSEKIIEDGEVLPLFKTGIQNDKFFAKQQRVNGTTVQYGDDKPYKNAIGYLPTTANENGLSSNSPLFNLGAGVTKVRIYIWVEGQDVDTINSAQTSQVLATINFTTVGSPDSPSVFKYEGYTGSLTNTARNHDIDSLLKTGTATD